MITVFDLGPTHPHARTKWERENGGGVVHLTTHQRDICERDPQRYVRELPAGATISRYVILS
jgi:hypothetical protein